MREGGNMGNANDRMQDALSEEARKAQEAVDLGRFSKELGRMSEEKIEDIRGAVEDALLELSGATQESTDVLDIKILNTEFAVGAYERALGDGADKDPKLSAFKEQLGRLRDDVEARKRLAA